MKRFYTQVSVSDALGVLLDGKPVRTPARDELRLPTAALAAAVADEWRAQTDIIKPESMVLTGLANAAIDRIAPERARFAAGLAQFGVSELLCYRAEQPEALVALQSQTWGPWLAWAAARYDVAFTVTSGILPVSQPAATLARLDSAFAAFDAFELAALNIAVTVTGSAVLGLAFAAGALEADAAWAAGQLDEIWQAEQWGKDDLALAGQASRKSALAAAENWLELLRR
jgi:chaperone required for assembly of F1-ATPase